MPDIQEGERNDLIKQYLKEVEPLNSEPARSHRFGMLLHALFAVVPAFIEDFVQGVEKYLKVRQKDRILKGRADHLFGNVIIEFEADLTRTRACPIYCLQTKTINSNSIQEHIWDTYP